MPATFCNHEIALSSAERSRNKSQSVILVSGQDSAMWVHRLHIATLASFRWDHVPSVKISCTTALPGAKTVQG